ncbi:MAG: O-antigen ligase family protein [Leptonema illini]|uniref:O-antigen ligase family protein n=1 Tax=Leptonema illini TaxID=183 RepID=A0A833LXI9_9LEPT|nr:MAG: O-antigen ligase family protein [Leptonema illini]PKL30424.1 MAG: hypothetical protein CVV45_17590 [Spirochaetae bacterium HGW-Spirochaetae-10]
MKVIGLFATATVITAIMPFYPVKVFAFIVAGWVAFLLLAWKLPRFATFLLFVAVPFFGNHPGGRFMELFPLLSFLWLAAVTLRGELRMSRRFQLVYAFFLLFLILPLALHPSLFRATSFYKNGLFHLLNANEHSPLYPFQQTIWLAFIPLLVQAAKPYTRYVIVGITVGFALTVFVGMFEILSPTLAAILDRLHVFLDGYVDRTPPHSITAGFHPFSWLTHSPNSFFWNRSWHAVFIIAALPFVSLFAFERLKESHTVRRRIIIVAASILLTLYLFAVGARGALLAWSAFLAVSGIGWILNRSASRLLYALPFIAIVGAFLLQIAVPFFIVFTEQGRTEFRYPQLAAALRIFAMFPLTGGGTESYGYYNNVFLRAAAEAAKHGSSHNQLLQIAAGNGLLGIFFYSGLLFGFANEIRKRTIAAKQDSIPLVLITAGMTSALVYGSVQEWNYLRPTILMWAVLLYLPWHYQAEHRSPEANRWWILTPVCILVLIFTYRSLPGFEFFQTPDRAITEQSETPTGESKSEASSKTFNPVSPWLGVEYVDPDRFVIMQGESHILLPRELQIGKITPLREDSDLIFTWSLSQQGRYLRIRCHSDSANIRGDTDARRLCAEITIPESTKYFQSLEDPILYRERTKQRSLF